MSSNTSPYTAYLNTLVEAQRGMSPTEVFAFLTTGEVPDLSQPPREEMISDNESIISDDDARMLLSGRPITASAITNLFHLTSHHGKISYDDVINESLVAAGKWKPDAHPRDRHGRFVEKGVLLDLLAAKKPTTQQVLDAVDDLNQKRWVDLTDAQRDHIIEQVNKLSSAEHLTAKAKQKLTNLSTPKSQIAKTTEKTQKPTVVLVGKDALSAAPHKYVSNDEEDLNKWQVIGPTKNGVLKAVAGYVGFDYVPVNNELRQGNGDTTKLTKSTRTNVTKLDEALRDSALTSDVRVQRGIKNGSMVFGAAWNANLTGASWTEHGFLSTSANPSVAQNFLGSGDKSALMNITVPAGTRGIMLSEFDNEGELLLERGLELRVTRDRIVNGRRQLDMEVVSRDRTGKVDATTDKEEDIIGVEPPGDELPGELTVTKEVTSVSAKPVVSAVVYKKHSDGVIIAQTSDGAQRMRWSASDKKFHSESRQSDGTWKLDVTLNKKDTYDRMRSGQWFAPQAEVPKPIPTSPITAPVVTPVSPTSPVTAPALVPPTTLTMPNAPQAPTPAALTTKTPIVPTKAVYRTGITDGEVIAESADGGDRWRWDASQKKFVLESRGVNGQWEQTELHSKKSAYDRVKSGEWFVPDSGATTPAASQIGTLGTTGSEVGQILVPLGPPSTSETPTAVVEPAGPSALGLESKPIIDSSAATIAKMRAAYDNGYEVLKKFTAGNVADSVELLMLSDGSQVVRKKSKPDETTNEFLSGRVANAVGIDDVVTTQLDDQHVITTFVDGLMGGRLMNDEITKRISDVQHPTFAQRQKIAKDTVRDLRQEHAKLPGGREIGLLDWLVANYDRHPQNWIVTPNNHVRPIDHGNALFKSSTITQPEGERDIINDSPFITEWIGTKSSQGILKSIKPKFTKAELQAIRTRLLALKSDFDERNEMTKFNFIISQVDRLINEVKK